MPWCPKCKRFQEEDDLCTYCWVETVDQLEPELNQPLEEARQVLLVTAADENEANIIQEFLKVNKVISLRKHRGMGSYVQIVTGSSPYGIDIFVLESQFDKAKDILASYNGSLIDEEDDFFEQDVFNEEENTNDRKTVKKQ